MVLAFLVEHFSRARSGVRSDVSELGIGADAKRFRVRSHGEVFAGGMNADRTDGLNVLDRNQWNEGG